jgi:hypothetical protein
VNVDGSNPYGADPACSTNFTTIVCGAAACAGTMEANPSVAMNEARTAFRMVRMTTPGLSSFGAVDTLAEGLE